MKIGRERAAIGHLIGAAGISLIAAFWTPAGATTLEDLANRIAALEQQNVELRAKVATLESIQKEQAAAAEAQQQSLVQSEQRAAEAPSNHESGRSESSAATRENQTTVSSYGEIGYTRPTKEPNLANVDVGRAVIGIEHQFDDSTKMVSEFEWEHAITSATDSGEAEVEQLLIEHEMTNGLRGTAGLYLMPAGLINQNHEPTAYYGVYRPDVDTKIIPSTWREAGVAIAGRTNFGLGWDAGLSTAPNLSKWDAASDEGQLRGPLQAIHGEGQFAAARDLGIHASAAWRAPGVLLGAFVFTGKVGQQQTDFAGNHSRATLWEVHGRYETGAWDFAAEFARGTISHTDAVNASFTKLGLDNPTFIPASFQGGYAQGAYGLWQDRYIKLTPFVRFERLNTAASYDPVVRGQGVSALPNETIWTIGASVFLDEGVVFKVDYRCDARDRYPSAIPPAFSKGDSLNLGMGYSF